MLLPNIDQSKERPLPLRSLTCSLLALMLSSCLPDGERQRPEILKESVAGTNNVVTTNYSGTTDLSISGIDNTVTITAHTRRLTVSGIDNVVFVNDGVHIEHVSISGIDNQLSLPKGFLAPVDWSGIDVQVVYREGQN